MIYNIVQYLKNNLAGENIFANIWVKVNPNFSLPDRILLLKEEGGTETGWFQFQNRNVQILARDIDPVKARSLIFRAHNLINNAFGLILPAVTIEGVLYPTIATAQISVNTLPQSLGYDEEGRSEFSANYRILMKE